MGHIKRMPLTDLVKQREDRMINTEIPAPIDYESVLVFLGFLFFLLLNKVSDDLSYLYSLDDLFDIRTIIPHNE